jgi:glucokinase
MARYSIAVDLGGTNLKAAVINESGKLEEKISAPTNMPEGREAVVQSLVGAIETLRTRWGAAGLAGIGVAVPGFILMEPGVIVGSNNMAALENYPVRDDLSRRLGTRVILENDANAAALGEKWMGAGRDVEDLVLLTLGTGIGGGIISGGKVLHGHVGMAGEIGHMTVNPTGNPCGCGNVGCLEKHASATAVVSMAKLLHLGEDQEEEITSEGVCKLAMAGDEKARMVFECMGRALGIAIGNLVNIFNFPLYLMSGGMLPAWEFFAPPLLEEVRRRSFTYRNAKTRIEKAVLGNEAGLYGAAYLPFQS